MPRIRPRGATVAATAALTLIAVGSRRRAARRPTSAIGSQSTGAGAGKVTFNPFSLRRTFKRAQTTDLRIGSQSTGAGAGKVTFNPFSTQRKSGGNGASGQLF